MSNLNKQEIEFKDAFLQDAFGRLRVSNPQTLFESKFLFGKQELLWDEQIVNGGGNPTSTHNSNTSSVDLTLGTFINDEIIRQTKRRINYQPGKSQLCFFSFNIGEAKANVRKRIGMFDNSDGIFLQHDGTNISFVIRSSVSGSVVENIKLQSEWNVDKLDGLGKSSIIIDFSKSQLMVFDFAWLGVGRVRVGFIINNSIIFCHEFFHANINEVVYIKTPNLPIRYEIKNISASASATTLKQICTTVISEGGYNGNTLRRSFDLEGEYVVIGVVLKQIFAIRIKSSCIGATIIPDSISILSSSNKNFYWCLAINPTFSGGNNPVWTSIPDSCLEYDKIRNGSVVNSGIKIASGYASLDVQSTIENIKSELIIGSSIANVQDELVLMAMTLSVSDNFYASLSWREIQ